MVDYNAPLYQHPPEVWDAAKCKRMANRIAKDGLGTKYPFKGYIGSWASCPPAYGEVRYNGGTVIDGEWWQGENRPFPIVAPDYEIIKWATWGWRIVAKAPN